MNPMMPESLFDSELRYQTIMQICRQLLGKGILSQDEYTQADSHFRTKYSPFFIV